MWIAPGLQAVEIIVEKLGFSGNFGRPSSIFTDAIHPNCLQYSTHQYMLICQESKLKAFISG